MAAAGFNSPTQKISKSTLKTVMNEISDGIWGGVTAKRQLLSNKDIDYDNAINGYNIVHSEFPVANDLQLIFRLKTEFISGIGNGLSPEVSMIFNSEIGEASTAIIAGSSSPEWIALPLLSITRTSTRLAFSIYNVDVVGKLLHVVKLYGLTVN